MQPHAHGQHGSRVEVHWTRKRHLPSPRTNPPPSCSLLRHRPLLQRAILHRDASPEVSYGLLQRLRREFIAGSDASSLRLDEVIDQIESALGEHENSIGEALSTAGATPTSVVEHLISERRCLRDTDAAPGGNRGLRENTFSELLPLRDVIHRHVVGPESATLRDMYEEILKCDVSTMEGKRSAIACAFDSACVLGARVVLNPTPDGSPVATRHDSLRILNGVRPALRDYLNCALRVERGSPSTNLRRYSVSPDLVSDKSEDVLFEAFRRLSLRNTDFVKAPFGVLGRLQMLHGWAAPERHNPVDYFCQPQLVLNIAHFLHCVARAFGAADISASGYTHLTLGAFIAQHLQFAGALEKDSVKLTWLNRASACYQEAIARSFENMRARIFLNQLLSEPLNSYVLAFDDDCLAPIASAEAGRAEYARARAREREFAGDVYGEPSATHQQSTVPLLISALSASCGVAAPLRQKRTITQSGGTSQAPKAGANAHKTTWLPYDGGKRYLVAANRIWDTVVLARFFSVAHANVCWPYFLANCNAANRLSMCHTPQEPGHESDSSTAHAALSHVTTAKWDEARDRFSVAANTTNQRDPKRAFDSATRDTAPGKGTAAMGKGPGGKGPGGKGPSGKGPGGKGPGGKGPSGKGTSKGAGGRGVGGKGQGGRHGNYGWRQGGDSWHSQRYSPHQGIGYQWGAPPLHPPTAPQGPPPAPPLALMPPQPYTLATPSAQQAQPLLLLPPAAAPNAPPLPPSGHPPVVQGGQANPHRHEAPLPAPRQMRFPTLPSPFRYGNVDTPEGMHFLQRPGIFNELSVGTLEGALDCAMYRHSEGKNPSSLGSYTTLFSLLGGDPLRTTFGDLPRLLAHKRFLHLPQPTPPASWATAIARLPPPLRSLAKRIAPERVVSDVGGQGQCAPNTLAGLLGLAGLASWDGPTLRNAVADHVCAEGTLAKRTSVLDNNHEPFTMGELILMNVRHWPEEARHGLEPTIDSWQRLIRLPDTWTDVAFTQAVADLCGVAIHMIGCNDLSEVWDMGTITPCTPHPPMKALLEIGVWVGRHIVAILQSEESESAADFAPPPPRPPGAPGPRAPRPPGPPPPSSGGGGPPRASPGQQSGSHSYHAPGAWGFAEHTTEGGQVKLLHSQGHDGESRVGTPAASREDSLPDLCDNSDVEDEWPCEQDLPLTTLGQLKRLLRSSAAPTCLVGFEFSGSVRSALEAKGLRAISADLRPCELGGLHFQGDVRPLLDITSWERAYLFPPCFQQLRRDNCLSSKISDGRSFWGCALVLYCIVATTAALIMVEQPDTIVADCLEHIHLPGVDVCEFRTSEYGDAHDKFVRLTSRNAEIPPPRYQSSRRASSHRPSHWSFPNEDARDRSRSTWKEHGLTSKALADASPMSTAPLPCMGYAEAIRAFAWVWTHIMGYPLPNGHDDPRAMPPPEARTYQQRRGPGDGRTTHGSAPTKRQALTVACDSLMLEGDTENAYAGKALRRALLPPRDAQPRPAAPSTTPDAPAPVLLPPQQQIDIRAAGEGAAAVLFLCTLGQPLVWAHLNGFSSIGLENPPSASAPLMSGVRALVATMVSAFHVVFQLGKFSSGLSVYGAPTDFAPPPSAICRSPLQRVKWLAGGATFAWCTLAALNSTPIASPVARAFASLDMFKQPVSLMADSAAWPDHTVFKFGGSTLTSVIARPPAESGGPARGALRSMLAADELLTSALLKAVSSGESSLEGWAEQIRPLDPNVVPESLLQHLPDFQDERLDAVPLSPVQKPLTTAWLRLPPAQEPAPIEAPLCPTINDIPTPEGAARARAWLRHTRQDLLSIQRQLAAGVPPDDIERDRPPPIAIGQSETQSWARGRVWDCRRPCCVVADWTAQPQTHLHLRYIRERLLHYPDQHLLANLLEGVRFDADVELQAVFVPHLTSLPLGLDSVEAELRRMSSLGWYESFDDLPFWPIYLNAQGSTARKLEPWRFRRTTEGGGPRRATYDASGLRAISINAASRVEHMPQHFLSDSRPQFRLWLASRNLPPTEPAPEPSESSSATKWPKEHKPGLTETMRDIALLRRAAEVTAQPIYSFDDDVKDYFNQLAMASCELWKLCLFFLFSSSPRTPEHAPLPFVSEKRLGFGTHPASNIAQRFSNAFLDLFREEMDTLDAARVSNPSAAERDWFLRRLRLHRRVDEPCVPIKQWTAAPEAQQPPIAAPPRPEDIPSGYVCPQLRLYAITMYTDDPHATFVGVERTLDGLRVWRDLTTNIGLIMAIASKRCLGSWGKWLGVILIAALGVVAVPKDKVLRATSAVQDVLRGGARFHVYRSLCGLLEHLRAVCLEGKHLMHGLYTPHSPEGASRHGPNGIVACDPLMKKQLLRWLKTLSRCFGSSLKRAILRSELEPPPRTYIDLTSDACLPDGDATVPGIGGFCHGLYWSFFPPSADHGVLTIPVLELLGICFNLCNFRSYLAALVSHHQEDGAVAIVARTDALSSALSLPSASMKASVMVETYQQLRESRAWSDLSLALHVSHLYGDCNPFSDLLSRGRFEEFFRLCRQMHIKPREVPMAPEAMDLYRAVVAAARRINPRAAVMGAVSALVPGAHAAPVGQGTPPLNMTAGAALGAAYHEPPSYLLHAALNWLPIVIAPLCLLAYLYFLRGARKERPSAGFSRPHAPLAAPNASPPPSPSPSRAAASLEDMAASEPHHPLLEPLPALASLALEEATWATWRAVRHAVASLLRFDRESPGECLVCPVALARAIRELAHIMGARNARDSVVRSIRANLAVRIWPNRFSSHRDCHARHNSSRGSYDKWKGKLTALLPLGYFAHEMPDVVADFTPEAPSTPDTTDAPIYPEGSDRYSVALEPTDVPQRSYGAPPSSPPPSPPHVYPRQSGALPDGHYFSLHNRMQRFEEARHRFEAALDAEMRAEELVHEFRSQISYFKRNLAECPFQEELIVWASRKLHQCTRVHESRAFSTADCMREGFDAWAALPPSSRPAVCPFDPDGELADVLEAHLETNRASPPPSPPSSPSQAAATGPPAPPPTPLSDPGTESVSVERVSSCSSSASPPQTARNQRAPSACTDSAESVEIERVSSYTSEEPTSRAAPPTERSDNRADCRPAVRLRAPKPPERSPGKIMRIKSFARVPAANGTQARLVAKGPDGLWCCDAIGGPSILLREDQLERAPSPPPSPPAEAVPLSEEARQRFSLLWQRRNNSLGRANRARRMTARCSVGAASASLDIYVLGDEVWRAPAAIQQHLDRRTWILEEIHHRSEARRHRYECWALHQQLYGADSANPYQDEIHFLEYEVQPEPPAALPAPDAQVRAEGTRVTGRLASLALRAAELKRARIELARESPPASPPPSPPQEPLQGEHHITAGGGQQPQDGGWYGEHFVPAPPSPPRSESARDAEDVTPHWYTRPMRQSDVPRAIRDLEEFTGLPIEAEAHHLLELGYEVEDALKGAGWLAQEEFVPPGATLDGGGQYYWYMGQRWRDKGQRRALAVLLGMATGADACPSQRGGCAASTPVWMFALALLMLATLATLLLRRVRNAPEPPTPAPPLLTTSNVFIDGDGFVFLAPPPSKSDQFAGVWSPNAYEDPRPPPKEPAPAQRPFASPPPSPPQGAQAPPSPPQGPQPPSDSRREHIEAVLDTFLGPSPGIDKAHQEAIASALQNPRFAMIWQQRGELLLRAGHALGRSEASAQLLRDSVADGRTSYYVLDEGVFVAPSTIAYERHMHGWTRELIRCMRQARDRREHCVLLFDAESEPGAANPFDDPRLDGVPPDAPPDEPPLEFHLHAVGHRVHGRLADQARHMAELDFASDPVAAAARGLPGSSRGQENTPPPNQPPSPPASPPESPRGALARRLGLPESPSEPPASQPSSGRLATALARRLGLAAAEAPPAPPQRTPMVHPPQLPRAADIAPARTPVAPQRISGTKQPRRAPTEATAAESLSPLRQASRAYVHKRLQGFASGGDPSMRFDLSPEELQCLSQPLQESTEEGINPNTRKMDERAWLLWEATCDAHGTSPLRSEEDVRTNPGRTAHLLASLALRASVTCRAKGKDRQFIKPASALAYPIAIIRIFKRWGIQMPGFSMVKAAVDGHARRYLALHGPQSLIPKRAENMTFHMMRRMFDIEDGTKVGTMVWDHQSHDVFIFRCLILFMMNTGFRLAEIVGNGSSEIMFLTWACLLFQINGTIVANPSAAQIDAMVPGRDLAIVTPPRSKPDQMGTIHCTHTIKLTLSSCRYSPCAALARMQKRLGPRVTDRESTPLFCTEGGLRHEVAADGQEPKYHTYSHSYLTLLLRTVLSHMFGATVAAIYSWHSFRSGLATALHAAGVDDDIIMLLCRWMCRESLHAYRRLGTTKHEQLITAASTQNVDAVQARNVVSVVGDQQYASFVQELHRDATGTNFDRCRAQGQAPRQPRERQQHAPHQDVRQDKEPPPVPILVKLTEPPAQGDRVIAPSSMWPSYKCKELGGEGWQAIVKRRAGRETVTISFAVATARDGRKYEDALVPWGRLYRATN